MPTSSPAPDVPSFWRYWTADAASSAGAAMTAVALPVLVVTMLGASPVEVGIVNAAQLAPYAVLGLVAGVYTDRWRRKPILIVSSLGRAAALGGIVLLWLAGALQISTLVVMLLIFGGFAVFGFAATQSLLPRIVPRSDLVRANSRLDQADTTAQTLGPVAGGGLVSLLGAPAAFLVGGVLYIVDAILLSTVRVREPEPQRSGARVGADIRAGLTFLYRHPVLTPLAVSTHVWFLANGAAMVVLSLLALRTLEFSAVSFGLLLTVFGVTSLLGASIAPAIGRRWGAGRAITATRVLYPIAWALVLLASPTPLGIAVLFVALALQGIGAGAENPNEMGLWQSLTPDDLLGRTNASRRAANRSLAALGAVLGGVAAESWGLTVTLVLVAAIFTAAAALAVFSPRRRARPEVGDL